MDIFIIVLTVLGLHSLLNFWIDLITDRFEQFFQNRHQEIYADTQLAFERIVYPFGALRNSL